MLKHRIKLFNSNIGDKDMRYLITIIILFTFITGCSRQDISTPDLLGIAFVEFINDGYNYDDFEKLFITPQEAYDVYIKNGKSHDQANKFKETVANSLSKIKKHWKIDSWLLKLRPFTYHTIKIEEKLPGVWLGDIELWAMDKNGEQVVFDIETMFNINGSWKMFVYDI